MADVDLSVYANEDLDEDFGVRAVAPEYATSAVPITNIDKTVPIAIDGATFRAQFKNSRGIVMIDASSAQEIEVIDGPNGVINLLITQEVIAPFAGQTLTYSLVMTRNGIRKRLWGGKLTVQKA